MINPILNTRSKLENWRMRMSQSSKPHFGNQVKYFREAIEHDFHYKNIIIQAVNKNCLTDEQLELFENYLEGRKSVAFDSPEEEAAFAYQFLTFLVKKVGFEKLNELIVFQGKDFSQTHDKIIEQLISPQINLIIDKMEKEGFILYVLERYKLRCEFFTRSELMKSYALATANYEQILEDSIRLYLFDQGINYPFSTPKSSSGRVDIISNIDTDDPLIAEIKIYDRKKGYGLKRVQEGFSQIVKYTEDYNKDVGFLILFNMDTVNLDFDLDPIESSPFPTLIINHKIFYIITINCNNPVSASKIGKYKSIKVSRNELVFPIHDHN